MRQQLRRQVAGFAVTLAALSLVGPRRGGASERLYVSAEDSGEIVIVEAATGAVAGRIPVGKRPRGMQLSRDGKRLFVALSGSPRGGPGADESKLPPGDRSADGIGVVDLTSGKLLTTYRSGQDPESLDLSRDGSKIFVSNEETAEVSVIDVKTGALLKRVAIGKEPEGVTVRPDGQVVYVTSEQDGDVAAIDTGTFALLARVPAGPRPRSIAFTPDGQLAFVTDEMGAMVTVIDAVKNRLSGTIKIIPNATTVLGPRPMGSVISRDGRHLYISNGRGESVSVIDVAKRKQILIIDGVGARPWGIGLSSDGKTLFTANGPSDDVSVIDIASGKVNKRIKVGGLPWGLVVAPRGSEGRRSQ